MGVRVFVSRRLKDRLPEVADRQYIVEKFKLYKESKEFDPRHREFGRDEGFERPHSAVVAKLMHVHVNFEGFPLRLAQFDRTSDTFLVYCHGRVNPDNYLLIEFLENAHSRCRKITFISDLAETAEAFRTKF